MMDFSQLAVSIDVQRSDSTVMIRPRIDNPTPVFLHYRMAVQQRGPSGNSVINQQGDVQNGVAANSVTMTLASGTRCEVQLQVFQDQTLLKTVEGSCGGGSAE
jgi:hypothetical protein